MRWRPVKVRREERLGFAIQAIGMTVLMTAPQVLLFDGPPRMELGAVSRMALCGSPSGTSSAISEILLDLSPHNTALH
jgi:hypothetical protein